MVIIEVPNIFAQILGVFPFRRDDEIFRVSKFYLAANVVVGFHLMSLIVFKAVGKFGKYTETSDSDLEFNGIENHALIFNVNAVFSIAQIVASLVAVATKFAWRNKYAEILNDLFEFVRKNKLNASANGTIEIGYYFTTGLCFSLALEVSSVTLNNLSCKESMPFLCDFTGMLPMIVDEIMSCAVCSMLARCHRTINQMITNIRVDEGRGVRPIASDAPPMFSEIVEAGFRRRNNGSTAAQKLEHYWQLSHKIAEAHANYSALHQFQLLLSIAASAMEISFITFVLFAILTKNVLVKSECDKLRMLKMFGNLSSKLIRVTMLCYYNGKAFDEGVTAKYTVQDIRPFSSEEEFRQISKMFTERCLARRQFELCGLFALNMVLPISFLGQAVNYAVVLIQFMGLGIDEL